MTDLATAAPRSIGGRALAWWTTYCHLEHGDAGVRARLRRCRSAIDALAEPAAIDLARRLGAVGAGREGQETVALDLARLLAHVGAHGPERPMRAAGWRTFAGDRRESDVGDDRPALSEVRFRRLLRAERGNELTTAFIRLVALVPDSVRVDALAADFWYWNDETRHRWAFDYYAAGSIGATAAPAAPAAAPFADSDSETRA